MKHRILLLLFVIGCLMFACKKSKAPDEGGSEETQKMGAIISTETELSGVKFIETLDTSKIRVFGPQTLPLSHEISNVPPAGSQKHSDCQSWAVGYGLVSYYYCNIEDGGQFSLNNVFSPSFLYNQLNGGSDNGASLAKALELAKKSGVCKWSIMPGDNPSVTINPTPAAFENAKNYPISDYFRFRTINLETIKRLLSKNYPLVFSFAVDENFYFARNKESATRIESNGRIVYTRAGTPMKDANHAMMLCGYDDNIKAFKALNSWGNQFGNNGYVWIDYQYFQSIVNSVVGGIFPEIYVGFPRLLNTLSVDTLTVTNTKALIKSHIIAIDFDGGVVTERGVVYGTQTDPTVADNKRVSGSGLGKFETTLENLYKQQQFYVRTYANSGGKVYYGNQQAFSTKGNLADTIENGNFSQGNTGFFTDYSFCDNSNCLFPLADNGYAVATNANSRHNSFQGIDNTDKKGKFLIVNGSRSNLVVWKQKIRVQSNSEYSFNMWIATLFNQNTANLIVKVNGIQLENSIAAPNQINIWLPITRTWRSGSSTTAEIEIFSTKNIAQGNDFGIDDIEFYKK